MTFVTVLTTLLTVEPALWVAPPTVVLTVGIGPWPVWAQPEVQVRGVGPVPVRVPGSRETGTVVWSEPRRARVGLTWLVSLRPPAAAEPGAPGLAAVVADNARETLV